MLHTSSDASSRNEAQSYLLKIQNLPLSWNEISSWLSSSVLVSLLKLNSFFRIPPFSFLEPKVFKLGYLVISQP